MSPTESGDELISRFSRCPNFPKTQDALVAFVGGLHQASNVTGISMTDIVTRCAELSEFCPTDYDLLTVAREIKTQRDREQEPARQEAQRKQWEAECGRPEPFGFSWAFDFFNLVPTGNPKKDFSNEVRACRLKAITDSLYYTEGPGRDEVEGRSKEKRDSQAFWSDAMRHHDKEHPDEVTMIRARLREAQVTQ